jgi:hypothetical protein
MSESKLIDRLNQLPPCETPHYAIALNPLLRRPRTTGGDCQGVRWGGGESAEQQGAGSGAGCRCAARAACPTRRAVL